MMLASSPGAAMQPSWSLGGSGAITGLGSTTALRTYFRRTVRTRRNAPGE